MKKQFLKILAIIWLVLFYNNTFAQQTICYPLANNFDSKEMIQSPLEVLPNPQGVTGNFVTLPANNNLCASGDDMNLYYFEKNAGLKFDNSAQFIDSEYTIEMVFKFENFPTLFDTPWLKILGFSNDDTGLFFYKNPLFGEIVFEFWQNNTLLSQCPTGFFNETDWYKLTLARNNAGLVEVYVNCVFMCSYDDSVTNLFLPKSSTGNQIIFFQDDPAIIASEASSGWVKNIRISDFAKTATDINASCDCLCEMLTSCEMIFNSLSFSCNPNDVGFLSDTLLSSCTCSCDTIFIYEIQLQASDSTYLEEATCDLEASGTFYQNLQNINGCDSIVILNVSLLESPYLQDSVIVNDSGNNDGNISINIAGGLSPYSYIWDTGATTFSIGNLSAGIYEVTVTDQNGCELILTFEVDMLNALSELPTSDFQISPNPIISGTSFQLIFPNTKTQNFQLEIFDAVGHLVLKNNLVIEAGKINYFLDHSIDTGIYFLKIKDKEGRSNVKKLVVTN